MKKFLYVLITITAFTINAYKQPQFKVDDFTSLSELEILVNEKAELNQYADFKSYNKKIILNDIHRQ